MKMVFPRISLLFLVVFGFFSQINAVLAQNEQMLIARNGDTGDDYGEDISINGDFLIIGADGNDENGVSAGAAYIYERQQDSWNEVATLLVGERLDNFGLSVSIDARHAFVGALRSSYGNENNTGSAYVFEKSDTAWVLIDELTASDESTNDFFGYSASHNEDYAIIGAPRSDSGSVAETGAAYIFERTDTAWVEIVKLIASDAQSGDEFGRSVSMSGEYVVVGARRADDAEIDEGAAYIFQRQDTTWHEVAKLVASNASDVRLFGGSVSMSGNYVAVGAEVGAGTGNTGFAYVFEQQGSEWLEVARLVSSDIAEFDAFGIHVSISGNYLLVGSPLDTENGSNSGSAYLFERRGSEWLEVAKLTASDTEQGDMYGYSVAISENYVFVGAPEDDNDNGFSAGSVYAYNLMEIETTNTSVNSNDDLRNSFHLGINYPNPFSQKTAIPFTVSNPTNVRIAIYDILGREVHEIVNHQYAIGSHEVSWNGTNSKGGQVPSGIYMYRIETSTFNKTQKMILLK